MELSFPLPTLSHSHSCSISCSSKFKLLPKQAFPTNTNKLLLSFTTPPKLLHNSLPLKVTFSSSNHIWLLISPDDHWGTWNALFATGAFGLWSEKTKIGSMISAALVSTLVGLVASNIGIISHESPVYTVVFKYLLPLTVPLLLFKADQRHVIKSTGTLFCVFLLGSVATVMATFIAYKFVPMRTLGQDSWKIAAALMGSYIGGAVNFVAISEALDVSPSVFAAGLAVDNVVCAIYFMILFALASKIPPELPSTTSKDASLYTESDTVKRPLVMQSAAALATSFLICKIARITTHVFKINGGDLPAITATVIVLATLLPKHFAYLAPAGDTIASVLMQVFFAVVGASGSIRNVITMAPEIFTFALIQVSLHLALILGFGKLSRFDLKLLLLASNANVGGPTTACAMATARGWDSLVVPAVLVGIFGISIATFIGIGCGTSVLKHMFLYNI